MIFKALLLLSVALVTVHHTNAATDKIVCFFASWAGYRVGAGSYKPQDIDPNLCTHILYSFLGVNPDGTLQILDPWNEIDLRGLANTAALKQINPDVKLLISIGGFNAGNPLLNGIVTSPALRANLVASCIAFFRQWGFDGIDIDWQFPAPSDKANFVKLLQEMRDAFDTQGYVLSVTASATPIAAYDVPAISKVVDVLNLMTYDFHTNGEGATGLNSPLYGPLSIDASITSWLNEGADAAKLAPSVAFFGHSYWLSSESSHGVGAPANSGIGGPYTQNPGTLGYNEICELYDDWTRVWDEAGQVPYKYDGFNWVSYDDVESISIKAKYAIAQGLGGLAVWSVDTDDFHGACGTQNVLLHAIKDNLSA